jgi:glycosyltransferase involved in cell wall biosynthesis
LSSKIKIELNIVGEGTMKDKIEKLHADEVICHGGLDEGELNQMYGHCDIFLAPTTCDTFSIVVLEAFASGMYVLISSFLKGRFDDFINLGYGEYVDPNQKSMSIAIMNAISNIELIRSKREDISTFVRNNYDVNVVNKKIINWVRNIYNSDVPKHVD